MTSGRMTSAGPATPAAKYPILPVPEALAIVLKHTEVLPAVQVKLRDAYGRVLAEDAVANEPVPPFRASIKDGYAVLSSDGLGDYSVEFEAFAGNEPPPLTPGTVAYIGTGGPVPEGADAVIQIEDTEALQPSQDGKRRVKIKTEAKPGQDIRPIGCDMAAGEVVLCGGTLLTAAELGILATVGAATVQVHRPVQLAVLSTGDEVVDPSEPKLGSGKIRDANRDMLMAAAQEAGAKAVDLGITGDVEGAAAAALSKAIDQGADILCTTGGVSMGDKDVIKPLLESLGQVYFGKVLMKPGKPLTFAKIERSGGTPLLVFGLPGNPVSSLVTFQLFVLPTIRKMQGWQNPNLRRIHVKTSAPIKLDPQRPEYHRAILHWAPTPDNSHSQGFVGGEFVASSTGGQLSSRLLSLRSANALLELPQASGVLPAGSTVSALVIGDMRELPVPLEPGITPMP